MRIAEQRCRNHPAREAACRCPRCRDSYCRECVTEHEGRLVCAECLKKAPAAQQRRRPRVLTALGPAAGLLLAWGVFTAFGWFLSNLPGHEFAP